MNAPPTSEPGNQLWEIYFRDREYARSMEHLPEPKWADKYAERLEAMTIEQTDSIKSVAAKLQNWHDELAQKNQSTRFSPCLGKMR